jgi:hypothetical protein
MKIFIVAHDQDLILNFKKGDYNNYDFILVGKNPDYSKLISPETPFTIIPSLESRNIENLPRLLTFTAWHYIANIPEIELCEDYIGIYEYDIKIHKNLDE